MSIQNEHFYPVVLQGVRMSMAEDEGREGGGMMEVQPTKT
jgi:hypothetical protein